MSLITEDRSLLTSLVAFAGVTQVVCFSAYEASLFKTAYVLAFFSAFCISELVPVNKQGSSGIWYDQVVVDHSGVHIWLQSSKTDQCGKGRW